jgi:GTP-binding protein
MFVDQATIHLQSGDGGHGCLSFRREKHVPRGGPDGGDGGNGGSVILAVDPHLRTLLDFRYRTTYRAEDGAHGEGGGRRGRDGRDVTVRVPPGTVVIEEETGEALADLVGSDQRVLLLRGGRGGKGNRRFKSPTHRAPTRTTPGAEGRRIAVRLTLKLIADVGLVGEPNAGKSTLISVVSSARPKVAAYPFTTLEPHLGMVRAGDFESFLMVDIPGLIEGAHRGRGLGREFLRHVERTRVLCFLVDSSLEDPRASYRRLLGEVELYDPGLAERPRVVVLTKADLWPQGVPADRIDGWPEGAAPRVISAVRGDGVSGLVRHLWETLQSLPTAGEAGSRGGRDAEGGG